MPQPHPGRKSFMEYLRNQFPWKEDWDASDIFEENTVFTYEEVTEALKRISVTDPALYRCLSYWWLSSRTLSEISRGLGCDPSTFKRNCQKAIHIVMNYLVNEEVTIRLDSLDLIDQ